MDFGVEGRSECVKLLTVVNLNQNSRRQDAPTVGAVGVCTGAQIGLAQFEGRTRLPVPTGVPEKYSDPPCLRLPNLTGIMMH